ncbi:SDR family NAD(P)-dependent oxidoreductase [Alloiococcus sp. CFN-8]|uniref:SDR family NAD(P)-dependent oxidoreductase n=1 Tax=Alloiococcus sp. CFN-8 TaxID=3416081 RepID=UPI003CFA7BC6
MKNAVITGGTKGLGLEMTKEFLKSDCSVIICGSSEEGIEKAKSELSRYENRVLILKCDVTKPEEIEALWKKGREAFGNIDIWINNAGINQPYRKISELPYDSISKIVDTNIKGMIYGSEIALKGMISQGCGAIYNMEGLGSDGMIQRKTAIYGTSKRALTYFTKALAKEVEGSKIIVGRLSPGMMVTDFITKPAKGEARSAAEEEDFKKIFNLLADTPETVAEFLVPEILNNNKNDVQIIWLTKRKAALRFAKGMFVKRELIK